MPILRIDVSGELSMAGKSDSGSGGHERA
jgi:hypothetical protein